MNGYKKVKGSSIFVVAKLHYTGSNLREVFVFLCNTCTFVCIAVAMCDLVHDVENVFHLC